MERQRFVNVATFGNSAEAHMARNELEAAGIPAEVTDDLAVDTLWHVGTALGGVKLMVYEKDAAAAEKVLVDLGIHHAPAAVEERPREKLTPEEEYEVLANRIWRAAIIGMFLCPGLLHVYCLYLLFSTDVLTAASEKHRWKLYSAFAISLLFVGVGLTGFYFAFIAPMVAQSFR